MQSILIFSAIHSYTRKAPSTSVKLLFIFSFTINLIISIKYEFVFFDKFNSEDLITSFLTLSRRRENKESLCS